MGRNKGELSASYTVLSLLCRTSRQTTISTVHGIICCCGFLRLPLLRIGPTSTTTTMTRATFSAERIPRLGRPTTTPSVRKFILNSTCLGICSGVPATRPSFKRRTNTDGPNQPLRSGSPPDKTVRWATKVISSHTYSHLYISDQSPKSFASHPSIHDSLSKASFTSFSWPTTSLSSVVLVILQIARIWSKTNEGDSRRSKKERTERATFFHPPTKRRVSRRKLPNDDCDHRIRKGDYRRSPSLYTYVCVCRDHCRRQASFQIKIVEETRKNRPFSPDTKTYIHE